MTNPCRECGENKLELNDNRQILCNACKDLKIEEELNRNKKEKQINEIEKKFKIKKREYDKEYYAKYYAKPEIKQRRKEYNKKYHLKQQLIKQQYSSNLAEINLLEEELTSEQLQQLFDKRTDEEKKKELKELKEWYIERKKREDAELMRKWLNK